MAEDKGDKTEQPTGRRLEDAIKKGMIAHSSELQTVFVMLAALMALRLTGMETWRLMSLTMAGVFTHLHQTPITVNALPDYMISAALLFGRCVGPVVIAIIIGSLLAGGLQNRFQTASEALEPKWERLNPLPGLQRMFSFQSVPPTLISSLKLSIILLLTYAEIKKVVSDPIFFTSVDVARIAEFMAQSSFSISLRVSFSLVVIAALDYAYQLYKTHKSLMMTKEEVKEESKNSEGDPQVKARMRRRRRAISMRKMLSDVPNADVVITNPTHLAIALRYDAKTMKAPIIIAKGSRLNALRIRELAGQHQIPIIENKPLARLMYKHGRVGGEVPAQLYIAVAELFAWVYRANRFKYYSQQNRPT
jgi:flagellar biosynthesis protein FlhB